MLPYDIDFTFGAAIHLTGATALSPHVFNYNDCPQSAHKIMLVSKQNRVALARRKELGHLQSPFQRLVDRVQ